MAESLALLCAKHQVYASNTSVPCFRCQEEEVAVGFSERAETDEQVFERVAKARGVVFVPVATEAVERLERGSRFQGRITLAHSPKAGEADLIFEIKREPVDHEHDPIVNILRSALRAMTTAGPAGPDPLGTAYREAGGGYEGLQAIAAKGLELAEQVAERWPDQTRTWLVDLLCDFEMDFLAGDAPTSRVHCERFAREFLDGAFGGQPDEPDARLD